jgi:GT2 family glycosyltransferase
VDEKEQIEKHIAQLERRIRRLEYTQRTLDIHITALENSLVYRIVRHVGSPLLAARARVKNWLAGTRLEHLWRRIFPQGSDRYASWIEHEVGDVVPALTASPRFGILLVVSDALGWLEEAVASALAQTYPHWELRICLQDLALSQLEKLLATGGDSDPRIRVVPVSTGSSHSEALNQAAQSTAADYLIVLDQAGRLAPNGLEWLADAAPADLIYSDEDRLDDEGRRAEPIFKPDWSPDLLLSCMYIGRVMAVSRKAWELAGGFREGFERARDHDLALRVTDRDANVKHVARVLYHRRGPAAAESVTAAEAAHGAGRRSVRDALRRSQSSADVEDGMGPCLYQLRWRPRGDSQVSLVICSRSAGLLDRCLRAVQASTYADREIIVVQHLGHNDAGVRGVIERYGARRVAYSGAFHFSVMNNLGADAATGDVLVFLNDDTESLDASWLDRLVGQVERPGVGVAGARLVYPSGTLQHAGVAIGVGDGCGHIGRRAITAPHWPWLQMTRDVAAVTGACLAINASLFRELGGFAGEFPINYSDIDLCLRVRAAGYRVVYDTGAVLRHYECQTRRRGIVTLRERESWFDRWEEWIEAGDPFYSPNLTREREDLSLRAWSQSL